MTKIKNMLRLRYLGKFLPKFLLSALQRKLLFRISKNIFFKVCQVLSFARTFIRNFDSFYQKVFLIDTVASGRNSYRGARGLDCQSVHCYKGNIVQFDSYLGAQAPPAPLLPTAL